MVYISEPVQFLSFCYINYSFQIGTTPSVLNLYFSITLDVNIITLKGKLQVQTFCFIKNIFILLDFNLKKKKKDLRLLTQKDENPTAACPSTSFNNNIGAPLQKNQ